jgi:SPP1 family predicted phage head-tail adaptor
MRAGQLRHKVTIQTSSEAQGATGDITTTWSTFATVNASIEPVYGREFFNNRQLSAEITHLVEIRYLSGVRPKMRILFGTRYFDIEQVVNDKERKVKHILMCKELV